MSFNKISNCYKLSINHVGLFGEGFLKKVEFELQRKDEISKGNQVPKVKPRGHPNFLFSHLRAVFPSAPLRKEGSPESQHRNPKGPQHTSMWPHLLQRLHHLSSGLPRNNGLSLFPSLRLYFSCFRTLSGQIYTDKGN